MIDFFCIRHGLDTDTVIRKWELSRVLQLLHAEGIYRGGMFQWRVYMDPEPELVEAFESASNAPAPDWTTLEPDFAP